MLSVTQKTIVLNNESLFNLCSIANVSFCCLTVFNVGFYGVEVVAARLSDESQDVESERVF